MAHGFTLAQISGNAGISVGVFKVNLTISGINGVWGVPKQLSSASEASSFSPGRPLRAYVNTCLRVGCSEGETSGRFEGGEPRGLLVSGLFCLLRGVESD